MNKIIFHWVNFFKECKKLITSKLIYNMVCFLLYLFGSFFLLRLQCKLFSLFFVMKKYKSVDVYFNLWHSLLLHRGYIKKVSSINKDSSNLSNTCFGYFFSQEFSHGILKPMAYSWFLKKLKKCCFWFRTNKKQLAIYDLKLLNSIPACPIPPIHIITSKL